MRGADMGAETGLLDIARRLVIEIVQAGFPNADDEYTPSQRRKIDAQLREARKGPFYGPFKNGDDIALFLKAMKTPGLSAKTRTKKP